MYFYESHALMVIVIKVYKILAWKLTYILTYTFFLHGNFHCSSCNINGCILFFQTTFFFLNWEKKPGIAHIYACHLSYSFVHRMLNFTTITVLYSTNVRLDVLLLTLNGISYIRWFPIGVLLQLTAAMINVGLSSLVNSHLISLCYTEFSSLLISAL